MAARGEPSPRARTRLRFRFLASPRRVVAGGGRVVGRARLDAETGIRHVAAFLAGRPKRSLADAERAVAALRRVLDERGTAVVDYPAVQRLEAAERARAAVDRVEEFKFSSDREML